MTLEERFWAKVDRAGPVPEHRPDLGCCYLWTSPLRPSGYGQISVGGKSVPAHQVAYEIQVGPIPVGHEPDHLCRVRHCVRGGHLEAVTRQENLLRGDTIAARNAAKTHCDHGHPFSGKNLYVRPNGKRACRECARIAVRKTQAKGLANKG